MDIKNKVESTYLPDKSSQKERVVIGLSASLDSMVAAMLLKIQKYDLFAVTIIPGLDSFPVDKSKLMACHLSETELKRVQDFCQQLNIPHLVQKIPGEFQEFVLESWVGSKLTGTHPRACWSCHDLRMAFLHSKLKDFDAKYLATGHYAKIFHHEGHKTFYIHSSNDEIFDQSSQLARLNHEILSRLLLPLSDLQKKEVLKLAENFGFTQSEKKLKMHECFPDDSEFLTFLKTKVPSRFLEEGELSQLQYGEGVGDHEGVLNLNYGEPVLSLNTNHQEKPSLAKYSLKDRRGFVASKAYFDRHCVLLDNCLLTEETSWLEPLKGAVKLGEEFKDCWVYPKSLQAAFVEWEGDHRVLEGSILTVFKKKGRNAKVLLSGVVRYVGDLPSSKGQDF
jgi:tRNA U34 2-thiouridine synthase MnmA/TrmU